MARDFNYYGQTGFISRFFAGRANSSSKTVTGMRLREPSITELSSDMRDRH